ncbi:MAG: glycosyltransferase family 4 protein [Ferruginibacter sp.]
MAPKYTIAIIENNILATNTIRQALTRKLMDDGFSVTVLTTGTQAELDAARAKGFSVIDVKGSNQHPRDIINYIRNIRGSLKYVKPNVVLTFTMRPAIWGNLVTRQLKIPTVTNITGIGPLFNSNHVSYKAARNLYRVVLKKTALVFFQNFDDMNLFINKKFVLKNRASRIPGSGIDHEYYKPIPVEKNGSTFRFLFISRLIKDKGILEYIEAAKKLKAQIPGAEFQVLGPLWEQNLKSNIITRLQLDAWSSEGVIKYLGAKEDVRPHIAAADCIVLPSYREGMSNILLEAASMQKPCITCDTTGCNDIVEDNVTGFLCKVRDASDLAQKMKKMFHLTELERTEMGTKARLKVIKEFDKQIVIDAYLNAIYKILQKN